MPKITEEQLISQLQTLKEIKPRKEWASSLKFEILNSKSETNPNFQNSEFSKLVSSFEFRASNFFFGLFPQKRLVYSFAAVLLLVAGVFGLARLLPTGTVSTNSTASLTTQTSKVTQSPEQQKVVAALNNKIKDLTKVLKNNPTQDPQILKEIVASLKTLADVPGTDSTSTINADLQDLYGAIVVSQIIDLEKTILTKDQEKIIEEAKILYNEGKYSVALEELLLINK